MKRTAIVFLVLVAVTFGFVGTVMADTVSWKGVVWNNPYGTIAVNGSGNLEVSLTTLDSGEYYGAAHYNTSASFRANDTPWVQVTWIDDLVSRGRLWIEKEGVPNRAWTSPGASDTQYRVYEWNPDTDWDQMTLLSNRTLGSHTLKVGKRIDGRVDYLLDGALVYTSDSANIVWPYFGDVYLAGIGNSSDAKVVFTDYQFGNGYTTVPLPSAVLLLSSGLLALIGIKRK